MIMGSVLLIILLTSELLQTKRPSVWTVAGLQLFPAILLNEGKGTNIFKKHQILFSKNDQENRPHSFFNFCFFYILSYIVANQPHCPTSICTF